jgi:ribosome-associated protein
MLVVNERIRIPEEEFSFTFVRSGGPGGQNVNKVASKAVLRWGLDASPSLPAEVKDRLRARQRRRITAAGELVLTSQRYRDQDRNRQDCLEKLCAFVREAAVVPRVRKKTRPSRAAHERRLADKRRRSAAKSVRRRPAEDT